MTRSELEPGMIILSWFDKRPELTLGTSLANAIDNVTLSTLTCGRVGVDVWSAEIAVYEATEYAKERTAP